jgi:anti-sigma factor RsiW
MSQCSYQSSLDAYHDGQSPSELAREIEQHLPACAACSAELGRLLELSQLLRTARPEAIHADELARVHQAVEGVEDRGVIRLVTGLSAVAASILIISGAWLYDGPRPNTMQIARPTVPEQTWERMASAGQIDVPVDVPQVGTALDDRTQRDTADWMVIGMGGPVEHGNH